VVVIEVVIAVVSAAALLIPGSVKKWSFPGTSVTTISKLSDSVEPRF